MRARVEQGPLFDVLEHLLRQLANIQTAQEKELVPHQVQWATPVPIISQQTNIPAYEMVPHAGNNQVVQRIKVSMCFTSLQLHWCQYTVFYKHILFHI
jgi:hypothetical protein